MQSFQKNLNMADRRQYLVFTVYRLHVYVATSVYVYVAHVYVADTSGYSLRTCSFGRRGQENATLLPIWRYCEHGIEDGVSWTSRQDSYQSYNLQVNFTA